MFGKQVTIPRPAFVIWKSPECPVSILTKGVGRGQWPLTFKGSGVFQKGLRPLSTSSQACRWTAAVGLALSHLVRPSEWSWSAASATQGRSRAPVPPGASHAGWARSASLKRARLSLFQAPFQASANGVVTASLPHVTHGRLFPRSASPDRGRSGCRQRRPPCRGGPGPLNRNEDHVCVLTGTGRPDVSVLAR